MFLFVFKYPDITLVSNGIPSRISCKIVRLRGVFMTTWLTNFHLVPQSQLLIIFVTKSVILCFIKNKQSICIRKK